MMRRVGRPGLIGLAARTAVVAGTAKAVGNRADARQARNAQAQFEQEQYQAAQQQAAMQQAAADAAAAQAAAAQAPPPPPQAAAPAPEVDVVTALQQLGDLRQQGLLDDAEFAAAKAKLLG